MNLGEPPVEDSTVDESDVLWWQASLFVCAVLMMLFIVWIWWRYCCPLKTSKAAHIQKLEDLVAEKERMLEESSEVSEVTCFHPKSYFFFHKT